jgi:hypothetical protein
MITTTRRYARPGPTPFNPQASRLPQRSTSWDCGKPSSNTAKDVNPSVRARRRRARLLTLALVEFVLADAPVGGYRVAFPAADRIESAQSRAVSSAGEHFPDTEGVTGSIPVPPTIVVSARTTG